MIAMGFILEGGNGFPTIVSLCLYNITPFFLYCPTEAQHILYKESGIVVKELIKDDVVSPLMRFYWFYFFYFFNISFIRPAFILMSICFFAYNI